MQRIRIVPLVLFAVVFSHADSTPSVFDASNRTLNSGLVLIDTPDRPVHVHEADGVVSIRTASNPDYFDRRGLRFRIETPFIDEQTKLFLMVEYIDTSITMLDVRYRAHSEDDRKAPASASSLGGNFGYGTGSRRRALFVLRGVAIGNSPTEPDFEILGTSPIVRLELSTDEPSGLLKEIHRELSLKAPLQVHLDRPIQLVMNIGADAQQLSGLNDALARMGGMAPAAAALGFNGFESYVKWSFVEPAPGAWDWSFYDAVVAEGAKHGLKWFPLLVTGSAYTLPKWYHDSPDNIGFACLEHGKTNNIQTIFAERHTPFAQAFLRSFADHYRPTGSLLGIRLGPSGNFGESQYPAGGNWGYDGKTEHIHVGWWAGDNYAAPHFRGYLQERYGSIEALEAAWGEPYESFNDVPTFIPQFAETKRKRKDFVDWYMTAMTDWCERWAQWARATLPDTDIYQSSGGWGFVESGTDFTDQTKSMARIHGGIRSTNETDSYAQTFYATRMLTSAARFYGVAFGAEPAGFGSARGVMGRLYNIIVNDGHHLFYYSHNLFGNDQAIDKWIKYAPLLDKRAEPFIEVAALYPDTLSKLDDAVFRNLYAFTWNRQVAALRPKLDFDFCSERMVLDGALPRYKVLLLLWNTVVEEESLKAIDAWVRDGGIVILADWRKRDIATVEDDTSICAGWRSGETGNGRAIFIPDDREPPTRLANLIASELLSTSSLDPMTLRMLEAEKPEEVYVSALQNGVFAILNFNDQPATVRIPDLDPIDLEPFAIAIAP